MKLHGLIDFRHWSSIGWLIFNSAVVAVLFGVRIAGSFGSSILSFVKRGGMISKRS
jgi:hypothetical protein